MSRRRVQTVVIALVVLIAVSASVLGGTLLVASTAPFDRAFDQQNGAHLIAGFDAGRTTAAQVAASAHAAGVSAAAGPFPTASISPVDDHGRPFPMTVVGRPQPTGGVDDVTLLKGRWATRPGEVVLFSDGRTEGMRSRAIGAVWRNPDLVVVGLARSVSETADGWVVPEQIVPTGYQMLYRLTEAGTADQVDAVLAGITTDALTSSRSWLTTRQRAAGDAALFVPFLIAFGVLGLVMAVLIVGNVIAGAVSSGTRRIGILKALGFTPNQVVRAYLGRALIPAAIGAALGTVAGNLLAVPVLAKTNDLYGTDDSGVTPWLDVAVFAGVLALVTVTAWVAASRAGRLRTVDALAVGSTPSPGRGRWAARLTARLPLPRPVTLGLAQPFARPVRSATIVVAIAFGAAAATFSVGLAASLTQIQAADSHGDVEVGMGRTGPPPATGGGRQRNGTPADPAAVVDAITAQPGTAGYCAVADGEVTAAGLSGSLQTLEMAGTTCADGYRMVSGDWYTRPGQIVVATPFLTATHTSVGDTVVLTRDGERSPATIVGEVFNTENDGLQILTAAGPDAAPEEFHVSVQAGTDATAYAEALDATLRPLEAHAMVDERGTADEVIIINALTALLTLMLVTVAALGVLNTVVLETRERVHDLGVHKALGMSPRQTITMVIASVAVTGLAGGALGAPVGVLLQRTTVTSMGHTAGFHLPSSVLDIYAPSELLLFGLGGLVIAVLGALLPAGWAAGTRTATALRTE
ncbi:FtsX-like permease family protein [Actinoplanes oblitus]|uniref:FtsX-like permease family protein n=1 Tax=Actinoplanes oblitus TaxID=3040509 RepID=A0ABY8WSD5_9ACTN|nr:FtsX-like permease family protein [Actinoplanes oblitus]WIM99717.1 FtsX-like permease family protein [Actinoplanes oblitus]